MDCLGTMTQKTEGRSQVLEPVHRITGNVTATDTHKIQVSWVTQIPGRGAPQLMWFSRLVNLFVNFQT